MNLKRLTYNTIATLIALVLVFGTASEAFADPSTPTNQTGEEWQTQQDAAQAAAKNSSPNMETSTDDGNDSSVANEQISTNGGTDAQAKDTVKTQGGTPAKTAATPPENPNLARTITSNVLGCSVGQILAGVITTGITSALNGLTNLIAVWTGWPVHDAHGDSAKDFQIAAEEGFQIFGVYVGVSLNSIAFCIVNSIIEYIANSVITWANSGFNGNPAFLQNPDRFFQGLADQQASEFINALAYNSNNIAGNVALNVCAPFRKSVATNLARSYGSYGNETAGPAGYASYGSCRLSSADQQSFFSGGKPASNYFSILHNVALVGANNYIDNALSSQDYLARMIAKRAASEALDVTLGGGYRSTKICTIPGDPNSCNITAPGSTVNNYIQKTTEAGQTRLLLTQKFDQVVTAIVNNLIRVALNKLLTPKGAGIPAGTDFSGGTGYSTKAPDTQSAYPTAYQNGQAIPKAQAVYPTAYQNGQAIPKAVPAN